MEGLDKRFGERTADCGGRVSVAFDSGVEIETGFVIVAVTPVDGLVERFGDETPDGAGATSAVVVCFVGGGALALGCEAEVAAGLGVPVLTSVVALVERLGDETTACAGAAGAEVVCFAGTGTLALGCDCGAEVPAGFWVPVLNTVPVVTTVDGLTERFGDETTGWGGTAGVSFDCEAGVVMGFDVPVLIELLPPLIASSVCHDSLGSGNARPNDSAAALPAGSSRSATPPT